MAGFADHFGPSSTAGQLFIYGVVGQVISALLEPFTVTLTKEMLAQFQPLELDPGTSAAAVARGYRAVADGRSDGRFAGLSQDLYDQLVQVAKHAPDLTAVLVAYRRGLIGEGKSGTPDVSLRGALTDAGIPAAWHDVVVKVAITEPTGAEVMNALLEGQITEDEARRRWGRAGMDPTWFQAAYDSNGEAPTPTQALELLNRGIIPEHGTGPGAVSYDQAFLEGPWRNKWLDPFVALRWYLPPPRTVTAMVKEGSLTHAEGLSYLVKQGLAPELAAAYLTSPVHQTTQADRELTKSDVTALYRDRLITRDAAQQHLEALRYQPEDAKALLDLIDARLAAGQLNSAVSHTRTEYLAGILTEAQARDTLAHLGVPSGQVGGVIATWKLEVTRTSKVLSDSQTIRAWYYELITYDQAITRLMGDGYSRTDAYLLMAIANKGHIANEPVPPGVTPAPRPTPAATP